MLTMAKKARVMPWMRCERQLIPHYTLLNRYRGAIFSVKGAQGEFS